MVRKELKSRSGVAVVGNGNIVGNGTGDVSIVGNDNIVGNGNIFGQNNTVIIGNKTLVDKSQDTKIGVENESNDVQSLTSNIEFKSLNDIIKSLRERDLYYDTYADFMNSDSKDGAYVEYDCETGMTTIYVRSETPQEAMDKLAEYGFISAEDAELFKSRFDELEAKGVDVSKIHGGDLSVLRDDDLFEEFANMAIEAQEKGEPISVYSRSVVKLSMEQRMLEQDVSRETINGGPDVQVGKSLSDRELLAKLVDVEIDAGLSEPDVQVGKNHDLEMGD